MEHECGIIGISGGNNIIPKLISGLNKLQHRGYESCGISYLHQDQIITFKNIGLVLDVFSNFNPTTISKIGIGHVRYSTAKKDKSKFLDETQPLSNNLFSLAHNGNIPFIDKIKDHYKIDTDNNSDSVILKKFMELLMETKYNSIEDMLKYIINNVSGTYCLLILTQNKIYAIRDRYGIRPLVIFKDKSQNCTYIASETIAFDGNNQEMEIIRDINPGEILSLDQNQHMESVYTHPLPQSMFCSFEYIYFMHHESVQSNKKIEDIRYNLGYELGLAEKDPFSNSVVIPIPNSSIPASKGFASAIKSVSKEHIVKNPIVKRTFILPTEKERNHACSQKFSFVDTDELYNKNIYLIDDSIVRGTTIKFVINQLKKFNPKTINIRITSPPVISPCYFGIDMSTREELIINKSNINSIVNDLEINSLRYLDIDDMIKVFNTPVCQSCFTGKYDTQLLNW